MTQTTTTDTFVKVTRVYGKGVSLKPQDMTLSKDSIESWRPSNTRGKNSRVRHRSTIRTKSGALIHVANTYKELNVLVTGAEVISA